MLIWFDPWYHLPQVTDSILHLRKLCINWNIYQNTIDMFSNEERHSNTLQYNLREAVHNTTSDKSSKIWKGNLLRIKLELGSPVGGSLSLSQPLISGEEVQNFHSLENWPTIFFLTWPRFCIFWDDHRKHPVQKPRSKHLLDVLVPDLFTSAIIIRDDEVVLFDFPLAGWFFVWVWGEPGKGGVSDHLHCQRWTNNWQKS